MITDYKISGQYANRDEERLRIEAEAANIAKGQVSSGVWNLQSVIFSYAIAIAAMIMAFMDVRLEIVAASSLAGLTVILIWGRIRYKKLYKRLYQYEIHLLRELAYEEKFNSLEVLSTQVIEKTAVVQPVLSPLTPRQRQIVIHIAAGDSNKQIAAQLNLSERTIKNQLGHIFRKLDVENRTQAVLVSIQNGWIPREMDRYHPTAVAVTSGRAIYEPEID
jgi:DNA-binding CsgD family transcriptional regulator